MNKITIRKIPKTLLTLERGSEEYVKEVEKLETTNNETFQLLQKFPLCANVGNMHIVNTTLDSAIDPVEVEKLLDEDGLLLSGTDLVKVVGKLLVSGDRSQSLHCTLSTVKALTTSLEWRLWTKQIDDKDILAATYEELFNAVLDKTKDIEVLQEECASAVKSILS